VRARFLGTGASGGTPGRGRSERMESSLLVRDGGTALLVDVTRHFAVQAAKVDAIDAILLTHAHRDACGGLAQLRRWCAARGVDALPVYAAASTARVARRRFARLDHCRFVAVSVRSPVRIGPFTVSATAVPHAREADVPTYAYRVESGSALVYASDVAELTADLRVACDGADTLVVDGAMWGRRLFSHLTIDTELAELCRWPPRRIVLTQIGRTAPPHDALEREVERRCARARPAYDGLEIAL
jgi:phosphoribosyl 1,2-cyclic phosphate phosphodiesterase